MRTLNMPMTHALAPTETIELIERAIVELDEMLRAPTFPPLRPGHRAELREEIARLRRRQQFFRFLRWRQP